MTGRKIHESERGMNNGDALEDEIAARKREDETNLTMLRFATTKDATPLLDAPGGRDEIADKIVEATLTP
jgi:hypothetical protein